MAVAMAATFAASAFAATAGEGTPGNPSKPGTGGSTGGSTGSIVLPEGTPGEPNKPGTGGSTGGNTSGIVLPEDATPGQIAGSLADALKKDPTNYENAKRLVNTLNEDKKIFVDANITEAMLIALRAQGKAYNYTINNVGVSILSTKELADKLEIKPVTYSADRAVFEANYKGGVQSALGTYVTISIPYNLDGSWSWVSDNGQSGAVIVTNTGKTATLGFFAPHFTKYTLTKGTTTPPTSGSGSGSVIKATGADMNTIMMGIVGTALVAGAGIAFVSVKKRALSK